MSYGNSGGFDPGSTPGGNRPYPQSYSDPGVRQPPPKSSNRALYWILGIVSVVTIGGALVCCGGGYFAVRFATGELANQFRRPIQASPEIAEHIGEIEDMTLSFTAMQAAGDQGKLVFEVKGTKGTGKVEVDLAKAESEDFDEAFLLIKSDGTRVPLTGVDLNKMADDEAATPDADDTTPPITPNPAAEPLSEGPPIGLQ
jgi:hypothetical protein